MRMSCHYRLCAVGTWNLWVHSEWWSEDLWREVLRHLESHMRADHPETRCLPFPQSKDGLELYLKMYRGSRSWGRLKDLFRISRAFRALKMADALSGRGFHVPVTVAAGEERRFWFVRRAFLLTIGIQGSLLPAFLREYDALLREPERIKKKRDYLRQLGEEIRRLHGCGFVHGDLVPTNIVVRPEGERTAFFYIDHDRTRRYRARCPAILRKRNLVQLNRFVLHGISLQDRMRFLRAYVGRTKWGKRERRLIRWLEKKTRLRRKQCDRVQAQVTFRELMRWNGPFAKKSL